MPGFRAVPLRERPRVRRKGQRSLVRCQQRFKGIAKCREGLRPANPSHPLDACAIGFNVSEQEHRSPRHAQPLSIPQVAADFVGVPAALKTTPESGEIERQGLRVSDELIWSESSLIGEQPCVHLPESALLPRAICRLGRTKGLRVDALQGKIQEVVADLPRRNVVTFDLWQRLPDVPPAERSLIIGELNNGNARFRISLEVIAGDINHHLGGADGDPSGCQRLL